MFSIFCQEHLAYTVAISCPFDSKESIFECLGQYAMCTCILSIEKAVSFVVGDPPCIAASMSLSWCVGEGGGGGGGGQEGLTPLSPQQILPPETI